MLIDVDKWGNSLAVRLPLAFTRELKIHKGTKVDLTIDNGILKITPKKYVLHELLSQITEENKRDDEWGDIVPRGRKIW